jgi:hypothetical protein
MYLSVETSDIQCWVSRSDCMNTFCEK